MHPGENSGWGPVAGSELVPRASHVDTHDVASHDTYNAHAAHMNNSKLLSDAGKTLSRQFNLYESGRGLR